MNKCYREEKDSESKLDSKSENNIYCSDSDSSDSDSDSEDSIEKNKRKIKNKNFDKAFKLAASIIVEQKHIINYNINNNKNPCQNIDNTFYDINYKNILREKENERKHNYIEK